MTRHYDQHPPGQLIPIPATTVSGTVLARPCWLYGLTLRESTGAAVADVDITNGPDVGAAPAATVTLKIGESIRDSYGRPGVHMERGIFLRVNAGSVRGSVWVVVE